MKKIILVIALFILSVAYANAQNLYCETYTTVYRDTVAVNGTTDAGSDWFKNAGYSDVWLQVNNGDKWYSVQVDRDCHSIQKLKMIMEGSDTSVSVAGYLENGQTVILPLKNGSVTNIWAIPFGALNQLKVVTTQFFVAFEGRDKKEIYWR